MTEPVPTTALVEHRPAALASPERAGPVVQASCRRARATPPTLVKVAAGVTGTLGALAGIGIFVGPFDAPPALWITFAICAAITAGVVRLGRWREGGAIRVDRDGLVLERGRRRRRVRPGAIEHAFEANGVLGLHLKNGAVVEAALDPAAAREALEVLGFTLARRAQSAPLRGLLGGFTRGFLAGLVAWIGFSVAIMALALPAGAVLGAPLLGGLAGYLFQRWLRPRLLVGADGLRLVGRLRPRFIPYRDVLSVEVERRGGDGGDEQQVYYDFIVVRTARGPLSLPVIGQSPEQIAALVARIEEGRAGYLARATRDLPQLDRGGRSVEEWVGAVRRATEQAGFRDAALSRADLVRALDDAGAPLERRVAAALVLATDDDGRERILRAAEQAADPDARAALRAVLKT